MIKSTEVYGNGVTGDVRILAEGEYRGLWYVAVSYISHPCCYVEIPKEYSDYDINNINCHGGPTYYEVGLPCLIEDLHNPESTYVGWDYAHCFDALWTPTFNRFTGSIKYDKIHTSEELECDCKKVIDQIVERRPLFWCILQF